MVHIYFQKQIEGRKFLQFSSAHPLSAELYPYLEISPEKGTIVAFKEYDQEKLLTLLSDVFYSFLVKEKFEDGLEYIIRHKFYFQEQEEVEAIIDIAVSIVEGEKQDHSDTLHKMAKSLIAEGLKAIIADKLSFSFDSFSKFRLKPFYDSLKSYVGLAIDEYKLEQDYQSFIAALRDLLNERTAQIPVIHLLHQTGFSFYNEAFQKLTKEEINQMIDRRLIMGSPLHIDSQTLAPLISIAPESLNLYTDQGEDGLIRTIGRIFEERTYIRPVSAFFHQAKKKRECKVDRWDEINNDKK